MGRRCVASLLSLAVIAAGGAVAHVVAYSLVSPDAGTHDDRVMHSGHGGANLHWHLCLAVCGSVALVGLASSLVDRLRGGRSLRVPLWIFALVPPVGFAVQEHLERFFHLGTLSHATVFEPVFVVGVLLQLPFAFLAFLAARGLLALTVALVQTLRVPPRLSVVSDERVLPAPLGRNRPRGSVLARGYGQRAPPLLAA